MLLRVLRVLERKTPVCRAASLLEEEMQCPALLLLLFGINCISCWCRGHPFIHHPRGMCVRPSPAGPGGGFVSVSEISPALSL